MLMLYFERLTSDQFTAPPAGVSSDKSYFLTQTKNLYFDRLNTPFSLSDLISCVNLSVSTLCQRRVSVSGSGRWPWCCCCGGAGPSTQVFTARCVSAGQTWLSRQCPPTSVQVASRRCSNMTGESLAETSGVLKVHTHAPTHL